MKVKTIGLILLAVVLFVVALQEISIPQLPSMEELQWDVYRFRSRITRISIMGISISADNKLWLKTSKGLFRHNIKTGEVQKVKTDLLGAEPLLSSVLADGKGGVWLGTRDGLTHIGNFNEGPSGRLVNCMVRDGVKGVWLGTDAGLQYLGFNEKWSKFFDTSNSGLPSNEIRSLIKDGRGGLWIYADLGLSAKHGKWLTHLKADGSWENIDLKLSEAFKHKKFTSLARDGNNGIWIGVSEFDTRNSEGGLAYFDLKKHTWKFYTKSNSAFPSDGVFCLESDGKGGVWVGTTGGLAHFSADKVWRVFSFNDFHFGVYDIAKDAANNIWLTTANGYAHFYPFTLRNIPTLITSFFSHKNNIHDLSPIETTTDVDSTHQNGSANFSENDPPLLTFHNAKHLLANKLLSGRRIKPPESVYFADEKSFYSKLLAKEKYDVLVVPFQTQYSGVDQVGRSFMTYRLASEIEAGTNFKVAPVNLVYRALGSHARYYQEQEVYKLANKLGVSRIIWGYAGIKVSRALSVCVAIQTGSPLSEQSKLRYKNLDFTKISFTHLPFQVFSGNLSQIMTFLQLPDYTKKSLKTYSILPYPTLPSSPVMLFDLRTKNPLHRACYFQLLGLLTPEDSEYIRNYFFIRSLVAISQVSSESAGYRLIAARALLYLHRRPAAMKIFDSPKGVEEQALLELLNGNLTELAALIPQMTPSIMKLLSEIELIDLRASYSVNLNQDYSAVTDRYPQWEYLLTQRMAFADYRKLQSNLEIKNILDLDFPLAGYSVNDLKNGAIAAGEINKVGITLELAYFDHIRKILKRKGEYYLSLKLAGGPDRFDYLMMLSGKGEANLLNRIRFESSWRKKYKRALTLIDVCSSIYKDHPSFLYQKIWAQYYLPARQETMFKNNIETEIYNNMLKILWWSGGLDRKVEFLPQFFNDDFMQEKARINRGHRLTPRELNRVFKQDFPPRIGHNEYLYVDDVMSWTHDNFWILHKEHSRLVKKKSFVAAKKLLEKYGHRFHGNPYIAVLSAEQATNEGNFKKAERIYRKIIAEDNNTWIYYHGLGQMYIVQGKYDEAGKMFLSFPFFKGENSYGYGNVTLSNYSYYAGEALLSHGAYKQAKKLFECCTSFNTGSQSDMASHIQLALMDNDFKTATLYAIKRAKRYNSAEAYGQYLTLLHLLGESDMAWALFNQRLGKDAEPDIWSSALVGHRIANMDFIGLSDWFNQIAELDKTNEKWRFLARYGMLNLMDRKPNMKMVDVIQSVDDLSDYFIAKGTIGVHNPMDETVGPGLIFLHSQDNKNFRNNIVIKVPNYASIARAYLLLQQKNYKAAYHEYKKRSTNYDYQNKIYGKALQSYLVWAGVKSGDREKMAKFIEFVHMRHKGFGKDFDLELAQAAFDGGIGNHVTAVTHLKNAFSVIPKVERRPQFPWYQIVELCEWLYEDSGNKEYRNLALLWAKKHQIIQPMFAWAYGVEAKYTTDSEDRIRALAFALYLDGQSQHISGFSKKEKAAANKWMETHNPFIDNGNGDSVQINGDNSAMNTTIFTGCVCFNHILFEDDLLSNFFHNEARFAQLHLFSPRFMDGIIANGAVDEPAKLS